MSDGNIFDKLVSDLNSNERQKMLDKLKDIKEISNEPLRQENGRSEEVNFKQEYRKLNILQKFFILLQQLFTGKEAVKLVEDMYLKRFMEKTQHQAPNVINFGNKKLLDGFCKELITLNNYLSKIKEPFQHALETNRKEFFAFFVSLQLENIQERLIEEVDPYKIADASKLNDSVDIKEELNKAFVNITSSISESDRSKLNHYAFSLHYLFKLCCFKFDSLIAKFGDSERGGGGSIPVNSVIKELVRLLDLLQSAGYPPPADAVEAVIMFFHHDSLKDPDIDIDETIKNSITRVESAFSAIRKFNKNVPLLNIIKCISRNLNYTPKMIKGGDDWFVLFKNYWEEKISSLYRNYYSDSRKTSFITNTKEFLKVDKLQFLSNYNSEKTDKKHTFQYPVALSLIAGFCDRVYSKMLNKSLNLLLLQGSFYKQENRTEFTDAYNYLNTLQKKIADIDNSLSPTSELGMRIEKVQREIMKGTMNTSHLDIVIKEIDKKVKTLIEDTIRSITSTELILNGVLFSQVGSKYDTISNLKNIGGKSNAEFINSWKASLAILHRANELLREIFSLENKNSA